MGQATKIEEAATQALSDLVGFGFDSVRIDWQGRAFSEEKATSEQVPADVWRWDTRLSANGSVQGSLTVAKYAGPQTIPPEVPLLVKEYAVALAAALARISRERERGEGT